MERILKIDGKDVSLKASSLVPRLYRFRFKRDMMRDMVQLRKAYRRAKELPEEATEEERAEASMNELDLTIFENVAYIMAKHADASVADSPEEWLDGFNMFSIYEVLPAILELWGMSEATTSTAKKSKRDRARGKRRDFYASVCRLGAAHR